jgi:hypothetical protein
MVLDKKQHRLLLFLILKDIFSLDVASRLAFKWGTLCYFAYWLDRFSTDIDLDLIKNVDEKLLVEKVSRILQKYWKVKDFAQKEHTIFWLLSYEKWKDNIKVEINKRIWKSNKYQIINLFWIDILSQTKDTIFANKLVALTDRKKLANRDIYDIWFFLKNNWPLNEELIKERTWKTVNEYLDSVTEFLNNLGKNYKILDWLGMVLDDKQKSFVKNKLLEETIWLLSVYKWF